MRDDRSINMGEYPGAMTSYSSAAALVVLIRTILAEITNRDPGLNGIMVVIECETAPK